MPDLFSSTSRVSSIFASESVVAARPRPGFTAAAFALLLSAAPGLAAAAPPDSASRCVGPQLPRRPFTALRHLLIDPGHGGGEPGTIGVAEIAEKHLVLRIAKRLRERLEQVDPGLEVRLTRTSDVDLSLEERAHQANLWSPELFLSLHLNAAPNADAQGIETLTLAPVGTAPGEPVPGREAEGGCTVASSVGVAGDDTAVVVEDLRRAAATSLSLVLAEQLQAAAVAATGAYDREVKQGRYRVLRGLYVPGLVIEMGFLSHPDEGRRIPLAAWQDCTVEAIIDGLLRIDAMLAKGDYPVSSPDAARPQSPVAGEPSDGAPLPAPISPPTTPRTDLPKDLP